MFPSGDQTAAARLGYGIFYTNQCFSSKLFQPVFITAPRLATNLIESIK